MADKPVTVEMLGKDSWRVTPNAETAIRWYNLAMTMNIPVEELIERMLIDAAAMAFSVLQAKQPEAAAAIDRLATFDAAITNAFTYRIQEDKE